MRILRLFEQFFRFIKPTEPPVQAVAKAPPVVLQVAPPEPFIEPGTPRYPPIDSGIQVAAPGAIIASQDDLIRLLRRNLGLVDADFQRRYMGPIYRAAELVNLLPASRDRHHTGAGGLFRFALTLAVRAAQASESKIFSANEAIERRRSTEIAWRHAAFLTGLTAELFRPLTDMLIVDDSGNEWSPFVCGLTKWAKDGKVDRFYVRWHTRDDARSTGNSLSSWAVNAVIGNEILGELHAIKPGLVQTIFGVASGSITAADNNTMAALINDVRRRTIEKDQQVQPMNYGRLTSGAHLEPYFLDTMRALLRKGTWQVNTKGGRCHYGADGFFIAWKSGATEMLEHLAASGIEGVPASRDTLAEMMGKAGIIKLASDGSWTHVVHASIGDAVFPAIQVLAPQSIIGMLEVKPVANNLRSNQVHKKDGTTQAVESKAPGVAATPKFEMPDLVTKPTPAPRAVISKDDELKEQDVAPTLDNAAPKLASTMHPSKEAMQQHKPTASTAAERPAKQSEAAKAPAATAGSAAALGEQASAMQPTSTGPRPTRAAPKGAIAAADEGDPDDEDDSMVMPKELVLELGAGICRELAVLRDKWNKGVDRQCFLRTPDGLAISYSLLKSMAVPMANFRESMEKAGYLHEVAVGGKKRRLAPLPFTPEKEELGLVILTAVARKAQFILE